MWTVGRVTPTYTVECKNGRNDSVALVTTRPPTQASRMFGMWPKAPETNEIKIILISSIAVLILSRTMNFGFPSMALVDSDGKTPLDASVNAALLKQSYTWLSFFSSANNTDPPLQEKVEKKKRNKPTRKQLNERRDKLRRLFAEAQNARQKMTAADFAEKPNVDEKFVWNDLYVLDLKLASLVNSPRIILRSNRITSFCCEKPVWVSTVVE